MSSCIKKRRFGWIFTIVALQVMVFADTDDGKEEAVVGQGGNETEIGPLDSHEAMNNREINAKIREKRNYEFLMGLVNNHSRYEKIKLPTDAGSTEGDGGGPKFSESDAAAGELLLEMLVKIVAHPDQWTKIHNLLQSVDADLVATKRLDETSKHTPPPPRTPPTALVAKLGTLPIISTATTKTTTPPATPTATTTERLYTSMKEQWPLFDEPPPSPSKPPLIPPTPSITNTINTNNIWPSLIRTPPFSYHRVTGRPLYLNSINKNPKAYIAVSLIAPKQRSFEKKPSIIQNVAPVEESLLTSDFLEKELQRLKPWTHEDNLKKMAALRSRWYLQETTQESEPKQTK